MQDISSKSCLKESKSKLSKSYPVHLFFVFFIPKLFFQNFLLYWLVFPERVGKLCSFVGF